LDDAKGALAAFEEDLALRKKIAGANKANYQWQRDVSFVLDRIGSAKLALKDAPGALAAFEERLAISRDLAELRKGSTEAQTDLVVDLYKLAEVTDGEGGRHRRGPSDPGPARRRRKAERRSEGLERVVPHAAQRLTIT
jgi:hypothetical protein